MVAEFHATRQELMHFGRRDSSYSGIAASSIFGICRTRQTGNGKMRKTWGIR